MEAETKDRATIKDDAWIKTICYMCFFSSCAIKAHRVNGTVVKLEGNPDGPHNFGRLCAKGNAGLMTLYDPKRVTKPLKRTNPEKGIGVDPKWVEISWDEALTTVADRMKKVRAENPKKLIMLTFDTPSQGTYFIPAFAAAFGTPHLSTGSATFYCGNSLHGITYLTQAAFYSDPDYKHCNYLILIGAQTGFLVNSMPNISAQEMADARMRGMKVIVVDPVCGVAGAKADEWLGIRPGTDGALALAMLNVLLNDLNVYDVEFLKKYTNGIYLVKADQHYLRDEQSGKPLVWDTADGKAKPYDAEDLKEPTLLGSYSVNGIEAKPSFQLLKDHIKVYTPEMAEEITTIPAETIRRIAKEFGEAARIGSKIVIDGVELPYRPVCIDFKRGSGAHKHAMLTGIAIQLLNIVVGAIDVPGGFIAYNIVSPSGSPYQGRQWAPKEGPDGLIMPGQYILPFLPFPAREVKRPERLDIGELFPVTCTASPMITLNSLDPEKYGVPYEAEILLHSRSNLIATSVNPEVIAGALKKIPFMVSFTRDINETAEFADIVFPDVHYLERLDCFANDRTHIRPGPGYWYWCLRQPVVDPPEGVRDWREVLFELADRVGMLGDLYTILNLVWDLKEGYKLDPNEKYTWAELADRRAKSMFGSEHDLEWFKEHGFVAWPKRVNEAYTRVFVKPRIPIYTEHFIDAGKEVKRVTEEMGLNWDLSDYQPLPDWRPCLAHEKKSSEFDLFAVSYKLPFHTFTHTAANAWLNDLSENHPIAHDVMINAETAKKKGIQDEDEVWIEGENGYKARGRVRVSGRVHPEVLGIAGGFGRWARQLSIGKNVGVHWNAFVPLETESMDMLTTSVDACAKVKVYK